MARGEDTPPGAVLGAEFYARPTLTVARQLIGALLVHESDDGTTVGRIVEVEAYIGEGDPACHARSGPTARNRVLYDAPGTAYVYLNYGLHRLLNAVTEPCGRPAAVLLRAIEPVEGLALMRRRRRAHISSASRLDDLALGRGPGNLTVAMGVGAHANGVSLASGALTIRRGVRDPRAVVWTPRIGIRHGTDRHWRCAVRESKAVSGAPGLLASGTSHPHPSGRLARAEVRVRD